MHRRSPAHTLPKFTERRVYYVRTVEWSLLLTLIGLTVVVRLDPRAEPDAVFLPPANVIIELTDIPPTRQFVLVKGAPIKPVIPIASDMAEEVLTDESDVNYGTEEGLIEIPAMPLPPGGKIRSEYRPPKLMVSKFPEYPKELQKRGVYGVVVLTIKVDTDGRVIDHKVKSNSTGNDVLEKLSISTVYKCRFTPAYEGRKPIVAWTEHTFEFTESGHK